MKENTKKTIIGIMITLLIMLFTCNTISYCISIDYNNIEYSGKITMKWKVDKLLLDWYRFEIDNHTILNVDNEYTWYKYNEGDNYTWIESEYIYPNWWLLW